MSRKILMTTMGLNIGGAETHIVELAKELKRQGMDIAVASNGGVYVDEIEKAGIRHYKVPMHVRSVKLMAKSYFMLKKIIKEEKPDVVHAHARIPAFICGMLQKTLKFPFVTTAHWVFETGGGLKYLTNWGQKTVAVSDDIKDYLAENYGIPRSDVYVTINGIDTDKFSPEVYGTSVIEEFGLDKSKPIISHVSRLDEDRALAARILIDIAPVLAENLPGVQILIAGSGNVYKELKEKADAANEKIGRRCLVMAGARTDISQIVAVGDIFVGVSRAALEAMAAEKPVVVAGNEGYIGIFESAKLENAMENNFCCRGCPMPSGEVMAKDIIACFKEIPAEQLKELGRYGREVIFEHYSVRKMAGDCLKAYKDVWPKRYNVLMSGYYGFNNSGDEAILQAINTNIASVNDDVQITVLSNNPQETVEKYGYKSIHRFSISKIKNAVKKCDVLISGGGSLLQDVTSTRSIMYYLYIIGLAKKYGKKVMLYANGIGPVNKPQNRERVKNRLQTVDVITLRDKNSAEELANIGIAQDKTHVTADPVFSLNAASDERIEKIFAENNVPLDKPFMAVSVRNWQGMEGAALKIAAICDKVICKYGLNVVFVPMQLPNDLEISRKVCSHMKEKAYIIERSYLPEEVMGVVGRAHTVFSMRLHALIFAARMSVPTAGMVYDPKTEYYLELLDMPSVGAVSEMDADSAIEILSDVIENHDRYKNVLTEKTKELQKSAAQNEQYLLELLGER